MAQDVAELPDPPRRRSLSFYFVLLFLVLPVWSIVPAAWAFVAYSVMLGGNLERFSWLGWACFIAAFCEVVFSIFHYRLARKISGPSPIGSGNLAELQVAFTRVLKAGLADWSFVHDEESTDVDRPGSPAETITQLEHADPRAIDFRCILRNWFRRAPWSSVRLHQVQQWIYWSIFNADLPSPEHIPPSHRSALDDGVASLEKRLGCKIAVGSNPDFPPLRLTLDKVNVNWRPLTHYFILYLINRCLFLASQRFWGLRYGSYDGLEYLIHEPAGWDFNSGPRPIVLIHGLGLGLLQYNALIRQLLKTFSDRPLLVLLQPHISQDIFHPKFLHPMTRHETTHRLARLISQLGWAELDELDPEEKQVLTILTGKCGGVTMLSHSNGSYCHAWMLKEYPELVTQSCFVDPVTFCAWEGDVCYNFIYRPCATGIELVMRYFVGTELGVANLLQRYFDWSSNSLFFEEIPNARDIRKTLFILGGKDDIVNAERVKRYLTSHGVRQNLWFYPESRHGQALVSGQPGYDELFRWLRTYDN